MSIDSHVILALGLSSFLIGLQILAIGFLLVILSSALWHNYLPLVVVATYVVAPLPNWICARCANPDDFMDSSSNAAVDFGRFFTGFLVLMGIGELVSSPLDPFPVIETGMKHPIQFIPCFAILPSCYIPETDR